METRPKSGDRCFVGREQELRVLLSALDDAGSGRGGLSLVLGEPGIGKTSLCDVLARRASQRDVDVLWALCEAEGAPPYWPWIQIVRGLAHERGSEALAECLGDRVRWLAGILPGIGAGNEPAASTSHTPDEQRFFLFDALSLLLERASNARPSLLVIDDLHAADCASLRLLEFLVRRMHQARILIVGAARETEARLGTTAPLLEPLAQLGRTVHLRGLDASEVACYIERVAGVSASSTVAESVQRWTGGNPLYVEEIVRELAATASLDRDESVDETALPDRLRVAIRQRLEVLSEGCRSLLEVASALGELFDLSTVGAVLRLEASALLDAAAEGTVTGLIRSVSAAVGRYRFRHALTRSGVYDLLPPARRVRLHRAIGEALEAQLEARADEILGDLAHHFYEATPGGCGEKALRYAAEAGRLAMRKLAWESATAYFTRALELLDARGEKTGLRRAEITLDLARAHRGDFDKEQAAALEASGRRVWGLAFELAQQLGNRELLAECALGFAGEWTAPGGLPDTAATPLLEEAARRLEDEGGPLQARVLTRLAMNTLAGGDEDARAALAERALTLARRTGDPSVLGEALNVQITCDWRPNRVGQRLAYANEFLELGRATGDHGLTARGHYWRVWGFLERGEVRRVALEIDAQKQLAAETRLPWHRWLHDLWTGMRALLQGRLAEADELSERTMALGQREGVPFAMPDYLAQRYFLGRERGELAPMRDLVGHLAEQYPEYLCLRSWPCHLESELGRVDDARLLFESMLAHRLGELPADLSWPNTAVALGAAAATIGDRRSAAILYDAISPYAGLHAVTSEAAAYIDSYARILGLLATALERWDEAQSHFQAAIAQARAMGARPRLARAKYDYAGVLLARGRAADREHALELFESAGEEAQKLGLRLLEADVHRALTDASGSGHAPAKPESARMVREGEYWTLDFRGHEIRLKDCKGLQYLNTLLCHPHTPFHALTLAANHGTLDPSASDSPLVLLAASVGTILDEQARHAFRAHIENLRLELAEAEAHQDLGRTERLRTELERVCAELEAAITPSGALRRWESPTERARLSVTKAIRSAQKRIARQCPVLARHLANCVKTGATCSYEPELGRDVVWHT